MERENKTEQKPSPAISFLREKIEKAKKPKRGFHIYWQKVRRGELKTPWEIHKERKKQEEKKQQDEEKKEEKKEEKSITSEAVKKELLEKGLIKNKLEEEKEEGEEKEEKEKKFKIDFNLINDWLPVIFLVGVMFLIFKKILNQKPQISNQPLSQPQEDYYIIKRWDGSELKIPKRR